MPIVSELVTIELVFLLKKIQLHLLVFFIVENSIVISRKISVDKESLKSLCRNSPQNESLRSRFQLLPTIA
jgi:hypothetical protein